VVAEITDALPGGWSLLPIRRVRFPRECCRCGRPTNDLGEFVGDARFTVGTALGQLVALRRSVTIPVPFCGACQRARRRTKIRGAVVGALAAAGLVVALLWLVPLGELAEGFDLALLVGGLLVLAGILGAQAGWLRLGGRDPVRLRRWSAPDGTVQAWFERPAFRDRVRELNAGDSGEE
jgi:hypothetical protein